MTAKKESGAEKTTEQTQHAAAQAIYGYFSADVNQKIQEMSLDQMQQLLRELEDSPFWIAILKFTNTRMLALQSAVNSLDPNAQATAIARAQGAMTGLVDMQNWIIQLVDNAKAVDEELSDIDE